MGSRVEFQDFSIDVKAALNDASINWLRETANEVASQADRNTSKEGWTKSERSQLRESYKSVVDESKGQAQVGTPLEQGYWEEWGTGEYAAHGDGRKGWWIYTPGQKSMGGGRSYATKEDAEKMAAYIRKKYHKEAVVTNGRRPNYTLEKSFEAVKNPAIAELERKLKERMGT